MLNKSRVKALLYGFEVRATAIIGNGLVHRVPKQQTLKLIRKELDRLDKNIRLSPKERSALWIDSYSRYVKVSRRSFSELKKANNAEKGTKDYEEELKLRKNIVYKNIKPQFARLEAEKNAVANEMEFRMKHDDLYEQFQSGIFYLCSTHINPAKDHADWEGKIYVSEDWEERVSPNLHDKVAAYIRNKHIRTVQWVTGEPVWLITRPNCKHYLIEVSPEEVLSSSVKKLLKAHDMYMEDEKEITYEYGQYKDYYERLKMLNYLNRMFDAEELNSDIKKTKRLVLKWADRAKQKQNR